MSNTKKATVSINKDAFMTAVKARNWTLTGISRHLGKSDGYVATRVCLGTVQPEHMRRIEELLRADPAEFVKAESKRKAPTSKEKSRIEANKAQLEKDNDVEALLHMIAELEFRITKLERAMGGRTFYEKLYGGKQA